MNIPHKTSPTLAINQKVKDLRAQGESVINAGFGENRFPLHPKLKSSDPEFHTDYESVQGILPLRKAVSTFYKTINNEDVKSANVIITPGCKGALFSAVAILDGDLLLPAPSWVSYAPQAIISGKKVVHIPTSAAHDYVPTYDELEFAHTQALNQGHDPKVLILNYPNNPTSCIATEGQIEDIVRFCNEHDIVVISDEIYSQLTFPDNEYVNFADYYPDKTIRTSGMSKSFAVGGWRIGWGIYPDNEWGVQKLAMAKALAGEVWSCVASPIQHKVIPALTDPNVSEYLAISSSFHAARTLFLHKELTSIGLTAPTPQGGFYMYVDFENFRKKLNDLGVKTSVELQDYLLDDLHIATLAGVHFGDAEENLKLRISTSYLDTPTIKETEELVNLYNEQGGEFINTETHPETLLLIEKLKRLFS